MGNIHIFRSDVMNFALPLKRAHRLSGCGTWGVLYLQVQEFVHLLPVSLFQQLEHLLVTEAHDSQDRQDGVLGLPVHFILLSS